MKELIISILLVLVLPAGALVNSYLLTKHCDALMNTLEQDRADEGYAKSVSDDWHTLKRIAAYTTPYDLVRGANSACEGYLCRLSEDRDATETDASLAQFKSALGDLRRIHTFSFELIF